MTTATAARPSANSVKSRRKPVASWRVITPDQAKEMLRTNTRQNRKVVWRKVNEFSAAMKRDRWNPSVSTAISIDWNGDIVNGFHRLMACVQAGVPFETLFLENVNPDTFIDEDTGTSRTAANFFQIAGEKNYVALAAGARVFEWWDRGQWASATALGGNNRSVSNEELLECVERNPILRRAASYATNNTKMIQARFNIGSVVALWSLTHGHPKHERFWEELMLGINSPKSSPARLLRARLDLAKVRGVRLRRAHVLALMTKAWNAYAEDKAPGLLGYGKASRYPEPITKKKPAKLPDEPIQEEKE